MRQLNLLHAVVSSDNVSSESELFTDDKSEDLSER